MIIMETSYECIDRRIRICRQSYRDKINISIQDPNLGRIVHDSNIFDYVFICVPTNLYNKKLSTSIVEKSYNQFKGIQVIRSTLPPESVSLFPEATLWPEFLREVTWDIDATQPQLTDVVGCNTNTSSFARYLGQFREVNVVTQIEAAMFKMARNAFLSTKVTFANALKIKCDLLKIDYDNIKPLLQYSLDATTHWDVPGPDGKLGFGGKCLPKDTTSYSSIDNDMLSTIVLMANKYYREE